MSHNNLNLFHGIKKTQPNARILPWLGHRLQQWVCVWKLLYNSFSVMRFSSRRWFSLLTPPHPAPPPSPRRPLPFPSLAPCVPALAGFSFNFSPPCPSHAGLFWPLYNLFIPVWNSFIFRSNLKVLPQQVLGSKPPKEKLNINPVAVAVV